MFPTVIVGIFIFLCVFNFLPACVAYVNRHPDRHLLAALNVVSLFSFALETDAATEALLQRINDDGRIYLTQTRVDGRFAIRMTVGSFDCLAEDVMLVSKIVQEMLASCSSDSLPSL